MPLCSVWQRTLLKPLLSTMSGASYRACIWLLLPALMTVAGAVLMVVFHPVPKNVSAPKATTTHTCVAHAQGQAIALPVATPQDREAEGAQPPLAQEGPPTAAAPCFSPAPSAPPLVHVPIHEERTAQQAWLDALLQAAAAAAATPAPSSIMAMCQQGTTAHFEQRSKAHRVLLTITAATLSGSLCLIEDTNVQQCAAERMLPSSRTSPSSSLCHYR